MRIELKNYRAFDDANPVVWDLHDGFTAFVGVNNAGKSSLLRFIHEARPAFQRLAQGTQSERTEVLAAAPAFPGFQSVADVAEVFCDRNDRDMVAVFRVEDSADRKSPAALHFRWRRPDGGLNVLVEWAGELMPAEFGWSRESPIVIVHVGEIPYQLDLSHFLKEIDDLARSMYLGPFRNATNIGGAADYYDLQIGEQFIARWDEFKTGGNRASNQRAIDVERELEAIFGFERLEINASPGNATLRITADDRPYQLQEQGAGLAQFIVVMAFVATQEPSYILIDEPELNLHPSLQLDFLTTLAGYSRRGVAFATHSIGLARALGQDVYSVRVAADGSRHVREIEATQNYVEFLGELSLSGYSELGVGGILLVEGPTEVPTIQRWLRLYGIEHELVLLPLGGSSLINGTSARMLAEIQRISSQVSVLIDSERKMAGQEIDSSRQEFVNQCEALGFNVHVLERRAIESYLTDDAIKAVKGEGYRALGKYEARTSVSPVWSKAENWRIASEMTREDLDITDLGAFLGGLVDRLAPRDSPSA